MRMKIVDLCDMNLTDAQCKRLCAALANNVYVQEINLNGNRGLTDRSALALLSVLQTETTKLWHVNYRGTGFSTQLSARVKNA